MGRRVLTPSTGRSALRHTSDLDGFTQGLIGAAASGAVLGNRLGRTAYAVGFVGGMLADADYLIRLPSDPLYTTVMHRGFSHALIFIPVGGVIAALPFLWKKSLRPMWKLILLAGIIGYATHGLLDACTTYGTRLLWPFSDRRVAWNLISVVDLLFSVPLLVAVIWGVKQRRSMPAQRVMIWCGVYLMLCGVQHCRVRSAQDQLAKARGHTISKRIISPLPGAALLYRSVYIDDRGIMHADSIRAAWFGRTTVRVGQQRKTFDPEVAATVDRAKHPGPLKRDLRRYRWFSAGFWARVSPGSKRIGDMRITSDPAGFSPLWALELNLDSTIPARPVNMRRDFKFGALFRELFGADSRHRVVSDVVDDIRSARQLGGGHTPE